MKKFIIHLFIYAVILITADFVLGGFGDFLQANAKGGSTKRTDDLVLNDKHDIVILGSSRAHHHYDTPFLSDTTKLDVYNAGYDGNGIVLAYGLLSLILERYNPHLVLFDVTPNFDIYSYSPDNNNSRYLTIMKPYYRHLPIESLMKDISYKDWIEIHSGMVRYNSRLITSLLDFVGIHKTDELGFSPMMGCLSEERTESPCLSTKIDSVKIVYSKKIISLAREREVPIVFIASPWYGATDSEVLKPLKAVCEVNNIPFLDYFADSEFQNTVLFNDPGHLNYEGARLFSIKLFKELEYLNLSQI